MTARIIRLELSDKDRRMRLKIGAVLGVLFSMASGFFAVYGYSQIANGMHSTSWPVAPGVVMSSELSVSTTSSNGSANRSRSYTPDIQYSYVVNGREYQAQTLQFIQDGTGKDWAIRKVAAYPAEATVEVFYDNDDPRTAVLEPGGALVWYLSVCAATLVFMLVFAVFALFLFRDVKKMMRLTRTQ